jgi:hypothetical protein
VREAGWYPCLVEVAASSAVSAREQVRRLRPGARRVAALIALLAGLLALAPGAQGRSAATLSLVVNFYANGTITVGLPDGTPVGTTSGTPTVIPAGYYKIVEYGPGGCTYLPIWELKGPGEHITDDMTGGEIDTYTYNAFLAPNSTYTWRIGTAPSVIYTFVTSADVQGTASGPTSSGSVAQSKPTSQDIVGSALVPFRGTLTGTVSATGNMTLAYKGKTVTSLTAGKYTIKVIDRSRKNGFVLESARHKTMNLTGGAYVGTRSVSVQLTVGRWVFTPRLGAETYPVVVS